MRSASWSDGVARSHTARAERRLVRTRAGGADRPGGLALGTESDPGLPHSLPHQSPKGYAGQTDQCHCRTGQGLRADQPAGPGGKRSDPEGHAAGLYRAEYIDWLAESGRRIPGIALSTDIIVGFPGESEAQFQDTLDLLPVAFRPGPRGGLLVPARERWRPGKWKTTFRPKKKEPIGRGGEIRGPDCRRNQFRHAGQPMSRCWWRGRKRGSGKGGRGRINWSFSVRRRICR